MSPWLTLHEHASPTVGWKGWRRAGPRKEKGVGSIGVCASSVGHRHGQTGLWSLPAIHATIFIILARVGLGPMPR